MRYNRAILIAALGAIPMALFEVWSLGMVFTEFSRTALLRAQTRDAPAVSERARALHAGALIFDGHIHAVDREFYHGGDIGQRKPDGQFDLPRAKEGGLGALFFSIFVTEDYYPGRLETKQALRMLDSAIEQIGRNSRSIEIARTAADIERIHGSGRIAAVLDIEGSFDLDGNRPRSGRCTAWGCARCSFPRTTGRATMRTPAARGRNGRG